MNLLLCSGLTVLTPNSFSRQLGLLAKALADRGHGSSVVGRSARGGKGNEPATLFDVIEWDKLTIRSLIEESLSDAIILIGYPDQFPFLKARIDTPAFFWHQCSKKPDLEGLENATAVPLTAQTHRYLEAASHPSIAQIIPHGVDRTVFSLGTSRRSVAHAGATNRDFKLLTVGANSHRKRFDHLIESVAILKSKGTDCSLTIKTDRAVKPGGFDLPRLSESARIGDLTTLLEGEIDDAELAGLYRDADIYLHTAEWEGFGIPVVEAMACGTPVVTHRGQGPGELVPYSDLLAESDTVVDESGALLHHIRPESMADVVQRLAGNPGLYNKTSQVGVEASVEYDITNVAKMWEELIR